MMKTIAQLRNLGPITESMLEQVGIRTVNELTSQDPVDIYILLKLFGYRVNNNMLWALYGAINDCDLRDISTEIKKELNARVKHAEGSD